MPMKKISAILIISTVLALISGCHKPDTTPPWIKLYGADYIKLPLDSSFEEPGFEAFDDEDGELTGNVLITNQVNFNKTGSYKIYYTVTDKSGNTAETHRDIDIFNEAGNFGGQCDAEINSLDGLQTITYKEIIEVSETDNHHLFATRFMDADIRLEMTVKGAVFIPQQQVVYQSDTFNIYQQAPGTSDTTGGSAFIRSGFFLERINSGQPATEYLLEFKNINPL